MNLKNIILNIFMVPTEFKNLLPNPICGFKFIANGEEKKFIRVHDLSDQLIIMDQYQTKIIRSHDGCHH